MKFSRQTYISQLIVALKLISHKSEKDEYKGWHGHIDQLQDMQTKD